LKKKLCASFLVHFILRSACAKSAYSGKTLFTSFSAFSLDLHSSGRQVVRCYRFSGVKHIVSFVAFGGGVIVLVLGVP